MPVHVSPLQIDGTVLFPIRLLRCVFVLGMSLLVAEGVAGTTTAARAQGVAPSGNTAPVTVVGFGTPDFRGQLVSATTDRIALKADNGTTERSAKDISRVDFSNKVESQPPALEVTLIDGSKLRGKSLKGKDQAWQLTDASGRSISLPNQSIRSALLKVLPDEILPQWQTAIAETSGSDAVVVLRASSSIDRINGVISEIKETHVRFELDGQNIEIPIEKIAGLIWFRRGLDRIKPTIEVALVDQSVWYAESIGWNDKEKSVEIKTQLGQTTSIPLSKIVRINYANAVIRWLAELEAIESIADKGLEFKTRIPNLDRSLASRFVSSDRLIASTKTPSDQDLWFPSPGRYVFRVPEGYTSLQSTVQRSDQGTQRSDLQLEVWQDETRLWQGKLAANQDAIDVDVPLAPGKKVRLVVACDSKLMIGTEVLWKQPRLKR